MSNQPLSEQYRVAGFDWADKNAAASLMEESKTAVLERRIAALGDIPHNRAERDVKASNDWLNYIDEMVRARTEANKAKVQMEYIRLKFLEHNSEEATKRVELKMTST